jgi:glyoxylase-like metal-dependent hydrolase (beta-lactamase superfamily II)
VCKRTGSSILIDVPPGARTLIKHLRGTQLQRILLTHSHIDHYAGLKAFRSRLMAPVAVHPQDNREWLPFPPEIMLGDGDIIRAGDVTLQAIHTPGHTPGSTSFRIGDYLIGGDTLFPGGPGRTVSAADFRTMLETVLTKILPMPDSVRVFPGHGAPTTLGKEKREFTAFSSRPHDPKLHGDVVWLTS